MSDDIRRIKHHYSGEYIVKRQNDGTFDVWRVFIASDTDQPWFYYCDGPVCDRIISKAFPQ